MRHADKLFSVFQCMHSADKLGTALIGLASVRRINNQHGGRTWAEGQVKKGTTFLLFAATDNAEKLLMINRNPASKTARGKREP